MAKLFRSLKENKRARSAIVLAGLVVMFFICGGIIASQQSDINRLKKQEAAYAAQLESQNRENAKLEQILDSEDRDEYIEQKAREKGYVKSDEIVFYDIAGSK